MFMNKIYTELHRKIIFKKSFTSKIKINDVNVTVYLANTTAHSLKINKQCHQNLIKAGFQAFPKNQLRISVSS